MRLQWRALDGRPIDEMDRDHARPCPVRRARVGRLEVAAHGPSVVGAPRL